MSSDETLGNLMTMHSSNSDADVRDIVLAMIRKVACYRGQLDEETRLLHDLSISGDDAWELLSGIQKRFGTSLSGMNFEEFSPMRPKASSIGGVGSLDLADRRGISRSGTF